MILESLQLLPKDSAAGPHTVNALSLLGYMPLICSYDCVHLPTVNSLPDM